MEEKEHLAQNLQPPRHLLTQEVPKIVLKMRDLTTFANKVSELPSDFKTSNSSLQEQQ